MTLYEIDNTMLELMESCIDEETGEINEEILAKLDELKLERDTKLENVACWIKNLLADAEALKKEKQTLEKRMKSCEKQAERLKEFLNFALDGQKFSTSKCQVSFRKSKSVECSLEDYTVLPEEYWKYGKPELKKTEIKDLLESGGELEGCRIEENRSVIIK